MCITGSNAHTVCTAVYRRIYTVSYKDCCVCVSISYTGHIPPPPPPPPFFRVPVTELSREEAAAQKLAERAFTYPPTYETPTPLPQHLPPYLRCRFISSSFVDAVFLCLFQGQNICIRD